MDVSLQLEEKGVLGGAEQRLLCSLELVELVLSSCSQPPTVQAAPCSPGPAGVGGDVFEASLEPVDPWQRVSRTP